jgi:hypothetical protein
VNRVVKDVVTEPDLFGQLAVTNVVILLEEAHVLTL